MDYFIIISSYLFHIKEATVHSILL